MEKMRFEIKGSNQDGARAGLHPFTGDYAHAAADALAEIEEIDRELVEIHDTLPPGNIKTKKIDELRDGRVGAVDSFFTYNALAADPSQTFGTAIESY